MVLSLLYWMGFGFGIGSMIKKGVLQGVGLGA